MSLMPPFARLTASAAFFLVSLLCAPAHAQWQHGLSLFGEPQLPRGFAHFPYVNNKAPKGGALRIAAIGSFDNLNQFTIKGNAASGLGLIHDTLMTGSLDEASAGYGLIAEAVKHAPIIPPSASVSIKKRNFQMAAPSPPMMWLFADRFEKAHPFYRAYYADVVGYEIADAHEISFASGKRAIANCR